MAIDPSSSFSCQSVFLLITSPSSSFMLTERFWVRNKTPLQSVNNVSSLARVRKKPSLNIYIEWHYSWFQPHVVLCLIRVTIEAFTSHLKVSVCYSESIANGVLRMRVMLLLSPGHLHARGLLCVTIALLSVLAKLDRGTKPLWWDDRDCV